MAALLGLAGCGGHTMARSAVGTSSAGVHAGPVFGDAEPVAWPGRTPAAYPVHGIDVSRWQGDIDWHAARRGGVGFAFIKATEGADHTDPLFARHWQASGAAGVPRGAYHFYYFCRSAEEQARWFIANVPRERGALPPVLDMEWNHLSRTCPQRPAPSVVRSEMRVFLDIVGRHYGQRPIIYTTPDFFQQNGLMAFAGEEIWLRAVTAHPTDRYGVAGWTFWQYTGTGLVPGVAGPVDINAFGGTRASWATWVAMRQQ